MKHFDYFGELVKQSETSAALLTARDGADVQGLKPEEVQLVIVDLDGTVADNNHRLHLIPEKGSDTVTEDWVTFNKACVDDKFIDGTCKTLMELIDESLESGVRFVVPVIFTGRGEQARDKTVEWLNKEEPSRYNLNKFPLLMRMGDDHRRTTELKHDVFSQLGLRTGDIVAEDHPEVCKVARSFGAGVLEVYNSELLKYLREQR